jgi:hypothetical protein|tara:strand:- start:2365 stop:2841 length:477 start_codon:yes stop_codon:yes gene_type:complete
MATIEQRFKDLVYRKDNPLKKDIVKSEDVTFFICEELTKEDFKKPFFKAIFLGDGFKFPTYCGKEQNKNLNKNALVIDKKLSKDNKVIYRCYLMNKSDFNIRKLFLKYSKSPSIKENNYSLRVSDYIEKIKEEYTKEELIYIINKIINELVGWSLKQK